MEINSHSISLSGPRLARHQAKLNEKQEAGKKQVTPQSDSQQEVDNTPADQVQKFVDSSDEMAALATQFRSRRELEAKKGLSESFERVLDEDVLPKVVQIMQVAQMDGVSPEELFRQAQQLFPDDSDLALVLREILRRKQMEEVVRKRLQALLKHVEEQAEPKKLKSGINCALKARLFGKALDLSPALLRASYRQFLENEGGEVDVYQNWISSYGYQRRALVLDFMEGALVTDMHAQDPSCSREEFNNLLGKLGQLKLLRSSDVLFIKRLLGSPVVCSINDSEPAWLLFMLSLFQDPLRIDELLLDVVGESVLLHRHAQRSSLLQVLYQACKSLPVVLFADPDDVTPLLNEFERLATVAHRLEQVERRRST
ncbi:type III secretion system gatekeeper subunit SctW [Iodobacter fluviatilis]|uniref:Type III secretion protein W n=1 Tax=Iodobacter fluviatilis TaxID=537 RepID=A0A377Q5Y9_9NEIS|nr:type III secretion system gatekeeper subunit SctW [Iodobacter fluviatilis]TCU86886.1 type III secretion protein W [Iodobacter fluviatilis]STQ90217.1 type III secretion system regulator InvE [Iodobacter fluviatilis]